MANRSFVSSKSLTIEEVEEILLYFSSSIFGQNSEEEILWDLVKNCISRLNFFDCVVYLLDKESNTLFQKAAYGPKNEGDFEIKQPITIPLGKGIVGSVAQSGIAEIVDDTSKDSRYIVDDEMRLSEITVPIMHEGEVLGILDSEHPQKGFFTPQHLRILSTIASICANKLVKARTEQMMREKQQQLLETEKKLASLNLATLRAQMNPHFIFNSLNAIQSFILINDQDLSLKYLSKLSKLIRSVMDYTEADFLSLEEELKMLSLYLELQKMRYADRLDYEIIVPEGLNLSFIKIPIIIIQPFVEEAIEKRLLSDNMSNHLKIEFSTSPENLICMIMDNGRMISEDASSNSNPILNNSGRIDVAMERILTINQQRKNKITVVKESKNLEYKGKRYNAVSIIIPLE